ncbi:MAG: hypothetical protein RTU30_06455 [Candidatus Thorarchaeota archaeon]
MDDYDNPSRVYAVAAWSIIPLVTILLDIAWKIVFFGFFDPIMSRFLFDWILLFVIIVSSYLIFQIMPRYIRGQMSLVGLCWLILFVVFDVFYRTYSETISVLTILVEYPVGPRFLFAVIMFLAPLVFVRTPIGDPNLFNMPIGKMATIGLLPSSLKIWYYRRQGAKIGEGVSIGPLSIIDAKSIEIGDHVDIGMACMIRCNELKIGRYSNFGMMVIIDTHKVIIGEEVTIQEQTYIGGLKTDKSVIEIGDLSMIFAQSVINPTHPIKIGKRVGIGGSNFLFTHGTWQPILDGFPVAFGPITIEDGVWFPWRVFVLPNVTIGKEATIGAGSVINKDVPPRSLAAGVPAKVRRTGDEYIKSFSHDEKCGILKDMLTELVGYLRIEDWTATDPEIETSYAMTTFRTPYGPSSEKDNHVIYMFEDKEELWEKVTERTFVVTLFGLDDSKTKEIEEMDSWWFDIENNTWGGKRTVVSMVINGWLARYGHWLKYTG